MFVFYRKIFRTIKYLMGIMFLTLFLNRFLAISSILIGLAFTGWDTHLVTTRPHRYNYRANISLKLAFRLVFVTN
jgi:hypothetical protein